MWLGRQWPWRGTLSSVVRNIELARRCSALAGALSTHDSNAALLQYVQSTQPTCTKSLGRANQASSRPA